jgi:hypothetical protein
MTSRFLTPKYEVSRLYRSLLDQKRIDNEEEGRSVGLSDTMVSLWSKDGADKSLPLCAVARSLVGDELCSWLAKQRGGFFVKTCTHLDGSTCSERCDVLKALAEMQQVMERGDEEAERQLWIRIQHASTNAIQETVQ